MVINFDTTPQSIPHKDLFPPDNRYKYQIPVDVIADYHKVNNKEIRGILRQYPTLAYLLGQVTAEPQGEDQGPPDNELRPYYLITSGSALFGLTNRDDALRWSGLFNHIIGTARQTHFLAGILKNLSPEQKARFADFGYDTASFDQIDPELLRNFFFISHARRREAEEKYKYNLNDTEHQEADPGRATVKYLEALNSPRIFVDLMRVENSGYFEEKQSLPDIIDNILTYCDWTFSNKSISLKDRFDKLRESRRASVSLLGKLEKFGNQFELALKAIIGDDIAQQMAQAGPYQWEREIRKAYCLSSGLNLEEVFPNY